jgi:hypothetical protein
MPSGNRCADPLTDRKIGGQRLGGGEDQRKLGGERAQGAVHGAGVLAHPHLLGLGAPASARASSSAAI